MSPPATPPGNGSTPAAEMPQDLSAAASRAAAQLAARDAARRDAREPAHAEAHARRAPAARGPGSFVAGAPGRLLPASVPLRFFAAAALFHGLAWLALLAGAPGWRDWHGGLGWPLAALHLVTLGTLLCSAIGASLQLLPVATRQPVRAQRAAAALWWIYVPGTALLALGMGLARPAWLAAGAAAVLAAIAAWAVLLALNLRGARGMPGVVLHGWGALAALALLAASAVALVALWLGRPLLERDSARALHLLAGVFGVMGLLVLGLSAILLPLFTLAGIPDERRQIASGAAALAAIGLAALAALATLGTLGTLPSALRSAAIAAGALALALHLRTVREILAGAMRRELGRSGWLLRVGWASLALALALALAQVLGPVLAPRAWPAPAGEILGRLFVLAAVGGWLLSTLFAVLQRILPFLAAMHAARGQKRPPTPSSLTLDAALAWHARGHLGALALLALAFGLDSPALVAAAALCGAAGAMAFGIFVAVLLRRLRAATAHDGRERG